MLLQCHQLAKNYGNSPYWWANRPIGELEFAMACLIYGNQEENKAMEKARKEAERKQGTTPRRRR